MRYKLQINNAGGETVAMLKIERRISTYEARRLAFLLLRESSQPDGLFDVRIYSNSFMLESFEIKF
jgi:hypothetical protein